MLPVEPVIERTTRPSKAASFAGELVLAPLSARGTPWMRRLGDISDAFASGLMRVRGVRRQRGYDRGFVLSDHADWPALLQTIAETGASRVLATHGTPNHSRDICQNKAGKRRHSHSLGRRAHGGHDTIAVRGSRIADRGERD